MDGLNVLWMWVLVLVPGTASMYPSMGSFFFLCNYHGNQDQSTLDNGEVAISVSISGNPEYYIPLSIYEVTVTSSHDFDGFVLTGLYTSTGDEGSMVGVQKNPGSGLMCSLVHNHLSRQPQHTLSFLWRAPTPGTGCIDFLATATLGRQVLFKDTTVMQICEEGVSASGTARPPLADIHEYGLTLRDDFDSSTALDANLWTSIEGAAQGNKCGTILHGNAITFCEAHNIRRLVTVPLNLTTSSVLQFAIGAGTCHPSAYDSPIEILYGTGRCSNWTVIDKISSPGVAAPTVHLFPLPPKAREPDTCLQWRQQLAPNSNTYVGCWALDNVAVINRASQPSSLSDDFDPTDPTNWIFFPGAHIRRKCHSDKQAMVFPSSPRPYNYATSRDVVMGTPVHAPLMTHGFDGENLKGWRIQGGRGGQDCGSVDVGQALIFDGSAKSRQLCTPYLDLRAAGSVVFTFRTGGPCEVNVLPRGKSKVFVYAEDKSSHTITLRSLQLHRNKEQKLVSVLIPPEVRSPESRLCWIQKQHGGPKWDVWTIDTIKVLPLMSVTDDHYLQFSLNLKCATQQNALSVAVEFSTDHGDHWYPLYQPCLYGDCPGQLQTRDTVYNAALYDGWIRHTIPLPLVTMVDQVRFRWRQTGTAPSGGWALDNVFAGGCPGGCHGHGHCQDKGCKCDFGYEGTSCESVVKPRPTLLINTLSGISTIKNHFEVVKGAVLDYSCGVLASGKAVVFNRDGPRSIQTIELNTTLSRFLQFSVRVGSSSQTGQCPPPDHPSETVLLEYTCTGGTHWTLLRAFGPGDRPEPRVELVLLPEAAQGPVCSFRWWQPKHSGQGQDVWAIDDLSLTNNMYNAISLDFSQPDDVTQALDVHLGTVDLFCGRDHTLKFSNPYESGQSRYVVTTSMQIGPSYALQFDLVMGCSDHFSPNLDNDVRLEFSTNHGMTWQLVRTGCIPPAMCEEYHEPTVYDAAQFMTWTRITLLLPPNTWSGATRFRWIQTKWALTDSWAVDNLYIGQQCLDMCHGHGRCLTGLCHCDTGYHGDNCIPALPLDSHIDTDFSMVSQLDSDWLAIHGGEVTGANDGCGTILSGESLYFSKAGPRQLVSRDLNTQWTDYIQFYIRIGGANNLRCFGASSRQENVLVQYSNNGGIEWNLLKELHHDDYRTASFAHIDLPVAAKSPSTRFRLWQPLNSGAGTDHWAIDQLVIGTYQGMHNFLDDFETTEANDSPSAPHQWQTVTEGMYSPYCQSRNRALMFANQNNDKFAMTKDLLLQTGDVVQFKINVGCSRAFSFRHPVLLQYSHDFGLTWNLLEEPCYLDDQCHGHYSDGSVYYTGPYGEWKLVVIPVSPHVAQGKSSLRWWQEGGAASSFALDDVYIGPACPSMCQGHGVCVKGRCQCDGGFTGPSCTGKGVEPSGMMDRFDNMNRPGPLWESIFGGFLGRGCGEIADGSSLYFSGPGTREARTVPLDTTTIRLLEFKARIGSDKNLLGCRKPRRRNEGVLVEYSVDNGVTWAVLKVLDAKELSQGPTTVKVLMPEDAKTESTVIRWWQPITSPESKRAEWAIDDVIIAVNDTSATGFQDNFDPMKNDVWYTALNAVPKIACSSRSNALEFSKNGGSMRYAETWDYDVTESTFLQFDIAMGCSGTYSTLYSIKLQYSVDRGSTWRDVQEACLPPSMDCGGYHLSSSYTSQAHANWTRVTLYPPPGATSPATRFRWLQDRVTQRGNVWALDNVYLGDGCSWMCSGHGYCDKGKCVCDTGFSGPFCVPSAALPGNLRDTFDRSLSTRDWPEVYGAEVSNICGVIVSGSALTFYKRDLRMVVSRDLDVSMAMFVQFTFKFGCRSSPASDWPREHSVLLQYSNNGGILWQLLKVIHFDDPHRARFYNVRLPSASQTNATRFRFWQPKHDGHMTSVWMLENLLIGGSMSAQGAIYETFDTEPHPREWLFWPGGQVDRFCESKTRADSLYAGPATITFSSVHGERSITTRDLAVNDMSVVQFDLKIGCGSPPVPGSEAHPVRLEYSADGGQTWDLVVPQCSQDSLPSCAETAADSTVYYSGSTPYWTRVVVPLTGLRICSTIRFRWYQGHFTAEDSPVSWALDNVYIGSQCFTNCRGHGTCINGILCECDEHYTSDECVSADSNPAHLLEDFEASKPGVSESRWQLISGGEASERCGQLDSGNSMVFGGSGLRVITSTDLDLSVARVVQFMIKLGCSQSPPRQEAESVLLQFTVTGGVDWVTIETFSFGPSTARPTYVALTLPPEARTNSTQLRWWQPTLNGSFLEDWALDQVYVGGDIKGRIVVQDDLSPPLAAHRLRPYAPWTSHPGGFIQTVCGADYKALHFAGVGVRRYAVTTDVAVTESTLLQFYISMGCTSSISCFGVELQYSLDFGKTWLILESECMPSNTDCDTYYDSSVFTSDVYHGWSRVTIPLPYYTRSPSTRFRWIQQGALSAGAGHTWSLSRLYIGDECGYGCNGHGRCDRGSCRCDRGWGGSSCSDPEGLPTFLNDDFSSEPVSDQWHVVSGASVSDKCGVLVAGTQLHFDGPCKRQLVSNDLDLRSAMFVQFHFLFGCLSGPNHRDEGVLIDYSVNRGATWTNLMELYYDQYRKTSYIMAELPAEAKANGVTLRWWQPKHPGAGLSDWAVDHIVIGGRDSNPPAMRDSFDGGTTSNPGFNWLQRDNIATGTYCGVRRVRKGQLRSNENATLMTTDMAIEEGFIVQFSLAVGCNTSWSDNIAPVHLQYSTDYGMTWTHLIRECLPYIPRCNGQASTPSIYYRNQAWSRITIALVGPVVSRATRLRWQQQVPADIPGSPAHSPSSSVSQEWGIDDVYIGPACEDNCHGQGICFYPRCVCNKGFGRHNCVRMSPARTYLKDTFTKTSIDSDQWSLIQGGRVTEGCARLVEGTALHFTKPGQRQAVTTDLDLRNARFVQYHVLIGGPSTRRGCGRPRFRNNSVVLQYSNDAGIQWTTLHLLDYSDYWAKPRRDYIPLPAGARTSATRLRWFQLTGSTGSETLGWSLDDVHVGGSEISPSQLYETFETDPDVSLWEFAPGSRRRSGVCGLTSSALMWGEETGVKSITTGQMIIQEDYMLQFKIMVGCAADGYKCNINQPVWLEYSKDPMLDDWELVYPQCFVNGHEYNMECKPYQHHPGTIYSANTHPAWTRVTMALPQKLYSSTTRLRWVQKAVTDTAGPQWAIDDVYIGERCPAMCHGRGNCRLGQCTCDLGYGEACVPIRTFLPSHMIDGFEGGVMTSHWEAVIGGGVGLGCGALLPFAHGKTLYFNGCGVRQAITTEMDTTKASKIMFVLQIGSHAQTRSCNAEISGGRFGIVLLQYTKNKGIDWLSIASHEPHEFLSSRRVAYDVPVGARAVGVQFRWWQPEHRGKHHDQWAMDYVEIIMTRKEQMLRTVNGRRHHGDLLSFSRNL